MITACSASSSNTIADNATPSLNETAQEIPETVSSSSYVDTAFENLFADPTGDFYWRIIDKENMFVIDMVAKEKGIQFYLDLIKSDNQYKQYFAINKLVEYYNDEFERNTALEAIRPLVDSDNMHIAQAAVFAVSILSNTFDNPNIYPFYDGSYLFTLFNQYSDYGNYNQVWIIKNNKMELYESFDDPYMYISSILVAPNKEKVTIKLNSNKSEFLQVINEKEQEASSEVVTSAKNMMAKEKNYSLNEQVDFENYSSISSLEWLGDDLLQFNASFMYNEDSEQSIDAVVQYNTSTKEIHFIQ